MPGYDEQTRDAGALMKILFVDKSDRTVGSSRIWVHDLSDYLKDAGHSTDIGREPGNRNLILKITLLIPYTYLKAVYRQEFF